MISTRGSELPVDDDGKDLYSVNIGRPDILAETIDKWREFHAWVETNGIEIAVSDAYAYIESCISETQYYLGGGFNYMFWFFSQEDKDAFTKHLDDNGMWYET